MKKLFLPLALLSTVVGGSAFGITTNISVDTSSSRYDVDTFNDDAFQKSLAVSGVVMHQIGPIAVGGGLGLERHTVDLNEMDFEYLDAAAIGIVEYHTGNTRPYLKTEVILYSLGKLMETDDLIDVANRGRELSAGVLFEANDLLSFNLETSLIGKKALNLYSDDFEFDLDFDYEYSYGPFESISLGMQFTL